MSLPGAISFISSGWQEIQWLSLSDNMTSTRLTKFLMPYHSAGLGLPEASVINYERARNETTIGEYNGIVDEIYGAGSIRSRSYSVWLDSLEKKTGHLLFGGIDKAAYVGALDTLETTLINRTNTLQLWPELTVKSSIKSVTGSSANPTLNLNLGLGATTFVATRGIRLPGPAAKTIYDALGADYTSFANEPFASDPTNVDLINLAVPVVPCSYLTNSSTQPTKYQSGDKSAWT